MEDDRISLAHGNGGRFMRELIEEVFAKNLVDSELDVQADAVPLALNGGEVMITTDGFTVQPLEFPVRIIYQMNTTMYITKKIDFNLFNVKTMIHKWKP